MLQFRATAIDQKNTTKGLVQRVDDYFQKFTL